MATVQTCPLGGPAREDHEYEQGCARAIQVAKEELRSVLGTPENRKLMIEDEALAALKYTHDDEDRTRIQTALDRYLVCVNRLWVYTESAGVTAKLLRNWVSQNRRNLAGIEREEFSAEATFAMRRAISGFQPTGAPLAAYAYKTVNRTLRDYRDARKKEAPAR